MTYSTPAELIEALNNTPGKLDKAATITEAVDNPLLLNFFRGSQFALDKLHTFGVKQIPTAIESGPGLPWDEFMVLADKLSTRQLTGHAARDAIVDVMSQATEEEWNGFYRRILIKDLRCGVSESTINKCVKKAKRPDLIIPVFACQLAHDSAKHEAKVTGRKQVEVKLDGVRVLTVVRTDGTVNMYSRNGKELFNFPDVVDQFVRVAPLLSEDMVFDGEIMSDTFQDLMTQLNRKTDVQTSDSVLYLFDMIPLIEFEKGVYSAKQTDRTAALYATMKDDVFVQLCITNIKAVSSEIVDLDTEEGKARYLAINSDAVARGYEGIMLKDLDAPYQCKRSAAWLKLKPFIEVTLTVVDVIEGEGKFEGTTGALVLEGEDDGLFIHVNTGSGLTDKLRDEIWAAKDKALGQLVEVKADAVTKSRDSETYSLRFPRFKTFRGFVPGEKL